MVSQLPGGLGETIVAQAFSHNDGQFRWMAITRGVLPWHTW